MTKLQFCKNGNNIITHEEYIAKDLGDCDSIHGDWVMKRMKDEDEELED